MGDIARGTVRINRGARRRVRRVGANFGSSRRAQIRGGAVRAKHRRRDLNGGRSRERTAGVVALDQAYIEMACARADVPRSPRADLVSLIRGEVTIGRVGREVLELGIRDGR